MGNDASNGNDSGASDTGTNDGQPLGDAGCPQYVTDTCDAGCATGTMCVSHNVGPMVVSGCYPDTQCTKNESACQCLSECVCKGPGSTCQMTNNGITCNGGPISRREFKKDIDYVDDAERAELASKRSHAASPSIATRRSRKAPSVTSASSSTTCRTRAPRSRRQDARRSLRLHEHAPRDGAGAAETNRRAQEAGRRAQETSLRCASPRSRSPRASTKSRRISNASMCFLEKPRPISRFFRKHRSPVTCRAKAISISNVSPSRATAQQRPRSPRSRRNTKRA